MDKVAFEEIYRDIDRVYKGRCQDAMQLAARYRKEARDQMIQTATTEDDLVVRTLLMSALVCQLYATYGPDCETAWNIFVKPRIKRVA